MRSNSSHSLPFAIALVVISACLCPPLISAQEYTGPSGTYTNHIATLTNRVWNVSRTLTNVITWITHGPATAPVVIASNTYPVTVRQSGNGTITGGGRGVETTVQTGYRDKAGQYTNLPPFAATYTVRGWIYSSRFLYTGIGPVSTAGITRGLVTAIASGTASINGHNTRVTSRHNVSFTVTPFSGSRRLTDSIIAPGLIHATAPVYLDGRPSFLVGNGSWTLEMTLATGIRSRVTGSAVVTFNSGDKYNFNVRGLFRPASQRTLLVLTASDRDTRGSVLRAQMTGDNVTALSGRLSGQAVYATFPVPSTNSVPIL